MAKPQYATVPLQIVTSVRRFQPFEGSNAKLMNRLLTGRDLESGIRVDVTRLPISPKQLMEARLGRIESDSDTAYLRSRYVNTSTAVISDPDSDAVVISPDNFLIYKLTPETRLVNSNLPITPTQYAQSQGFRLTADQVRTLRDNAYNLPKLRRQFWEECAAEGDTKLAVDYIGDVERTTGLNFNENAMGLYVPSSKGLRLLGVNSVDGNNRSNANGYDDLGDDYGRLVGVAAEPQFVAQKMGISLEELTKD